MEKDLSEVGHCEFGDIDPASLVFEYPEDEKSLRSTFGPLKVIGIQFEYKDKDKEERDKRSVECNRLAIIPGTDHQAMFPEGVEKLPDGWRWF